MALTQEQWYQKIKTWVPAWWWEREQYSRATFQGIAAMLAQLEADAQAHAEQTFITLTTSPILDTLGDERGIARLTGEGEAQYAARVQRITSAVDLDSIKSIVDSLLLTGECTIKEGYNGGLYCDGGAYVDDDAFIFEYFYNAFLVICDPQFLTGESFIGAAYSDEEHLGSGDSTSGVYDSIVAAVDRAKALGVGWMLVERT